MNLRANPETKFLLKYLIIGLGCLAFACWSVYDGFVKFPAEIPRAEAWAQLETEFADDKSKVFIAWKKIAKENNWNSKPLGPDDSVDAIQTKIIYQYIFMALGVGIGLPCLIWYLRSKNSWIESTEDGLRSSSGTELKISQIQKFDKKKWERKGIGVLHFKADDGSEQRFIVDDLKYDRQTTDKIVRWVESQIPAEMIVNGSPESGLAADSDPDSESDPESETDAESDQTA